ncbi:hypothetical protein DK910_004609, partial [Escherichia coli]|nr:hypothetical protein [Escherichia coli]EKY4663280.1 hypothetical protein [Escherichia coli]HDL0279599.1 hypothetical protein [Escherichia coli]
MEVSVIFFWVIYALIVISFLKSIITDLIKEKNKTGVALYISILLSVGYTFQYIHNYDIFSASWGIGIFVTIIVLSIVFNLLCILSKRILISRHIRKMQKKLKQTSVSDFIYYLMEKHNK